MSIEAIPPGVLETLKIRFLLAYGHQRTRRDMVRVYGLERGLFEYDGVRKQAQRDEIAGKLRYVRQLLKEKGYCPVDVKRFLLSQAGVDWTK